MRSRFSTFDRVVARVLVTALVVMNGWSLAPFPSAVSTVSAQSPAPQTVTFYGPQTFTRTKGKPNVFSVTVNVPPGVGGPFTLHVQNGEPDHAAGIRHGADDDDDDDDDEGGDRRDHHQVAHHFRITKAEIAINGLVVASKADFHSHTPSVDKTVVLTPRSTMTVTLRGKPNCFIIVSILGRTVDRTPPQIAVVAPKANTVSASRTPELVVSYADPAGTAGASGVDPNTLVVRVDGVDLTSLFTRGASQATAQLTSTQALADGAHTVNATIADRAGNSGSTSSTFTVDGTAPTIQTIDPPAGRFVNTTTPTIRVRYSDVDGVDLSTLRVLVGGQDRTSLFTKGATDAVATLDAASALGQGAVDLVATIRDSVGNTGTSSSSFVVDSVTPAVEIVQPGIDHYTFANAIDVTGMVTDASPSTVVVNGVSATVNGSAFTASGVPLGVGPEMALQVTATDAAGNIGQASRTVYIDRVNPVVQIAQPIAGAFVSGATVGVAGTVADASAVTVKVNGAPAIMVNGANRSFTATVPAPNGPLTVEAVAEDAAGNSTTASVTVTVDSVAPVLTLTSPAEGFLTNQPTVHVAGTVADATPVIATINGAPVAVTDGAFAFDAPVPPGTTTIAVSAVDAAGNASSAVVHGSVDRSAPVLQIVAPASGAYLATSTPALRIVYQDNDAVDRASLRILVDGEDRTPLVAAGASEATATLPALIDGTHQVSATIRDAAGNEATTSTSFFTDVAGPTLQIGAPAVNAFLKGPSVLVNGTVTDLAIASVTVNGQAAVVSPPSSDVASGFPSPGLGAGSRTFTAQVQSVDGPLAIEVVATDAAGNQTTASRTIAVDSVAPVVTVSAPARDLVTNQTSVRVQGSVSDSSPVALTIGGVAVPVASGAFAYEAPLASAGAVTIPVIAIDAAGNETTTTVSVTVDRAAPAIQITAPSPGAFLPGPSVTVTGTVSDASSAGVSVNGVAASTAVVSGFPSPGLGAGSRTFSATVPVADGAVTLQATATDAAGNTSTASADITIDSVAPVVAVVHPTDGQYTNATEISVSGTVTDATAVTIAVNGIAATVNGSAFAATIPVGSGPASPISIVATDAAGNTSQQSLSLQVDRSAPAISITAPAANAYLKGPSVAVSGTVDDVAIATVTVNGQPATLTPPPSNVVSGFPSPGLGAGSRTFTAQVQSGDGPLTIAVVATDVAGNQSTASRTLTLDSVAPVVTVSAPADGLVTNQTSVRVEGSATDSSPVTLTIGGVTVPVASNAFAYDAPLTSDGTIGIPIVATDAAGNVASTTVSVTADRSAPAIQITTPTSSSFLRGPNVAVTGTVSDASATSVSVNGVAATLDPGSSVASGSPGLGASSRTFTATVPVADGAVTLQADATDAAGNTSSASTAITVDSAAPIITVTAPASGLVTNQSSVRVQGSIQDATPVTLTIDGAIIPVSSGAFAYDAPLGADGAATFALVATDAAGNSSNTSVTVTVDRTAPAVTIASPASGAFVKGPTVEVTGSVSDAATASVSVNGVAATLTSVMSGFPSPGLGAGSRTFTATVPVTDGVLTLRASALDAAGNTSQASIDITVDQAAPVITVLQPADGQYTNATDIEVSAGVSDATAVTVTINGVAATSNGSTFSATVPVGPRGNVGDVGDVATAPITIVATDAAGNSSQRTLSLRVDRVPPSIAITSPVAGAYRKGPIVDVTGTVADGSPVSVDVNGQAAIVTGDTFAAQVPSGDGPLTIVAAAADRAGNTATAQRAVIVDSVAPVISVSSPADGAITNQLMAHLTGAIADASPVTLRVGSTLVPVSSSATFEADVTIGAEGANTLTLRATDAAGNESTFDLHATLDQTAPDLEITSPAAGALLGALPIPVQGFVYDATATTVTVNGVPAARVQDVWQTSIGGLAEGTQLFTVTATDAAGNTRTVTRNVTLDVSAPAITIATPAADALTNAGSIHVSGSATDVTLSSVAINGVAASLSPPPAQVVSGLSRTFGATVPLSEGDNHLIAVATDALGRASQAEVVVTRDSTPPTVSITSPDTLSRARGGAATIAASDSVGLTSIDVTLNGAPVGSSATAPFDVTLAVPVAVTAGAVMTLVATATDRAGNTAAATHTLRVISDGVVVGQVLSDVTGLPIAGASVTSSGGSGAAGGTTGLSVAQGFSPAISDDRGGYSMAATDASVLLTISKDGMTAVDRQVPVQTGVGTAVVDARLTPIAPATIVPASGTVTSGNISLNLSAGTSIALTRLSAQGLPALLPLGWSPLAAFDVRGDVQVPSATVAAQGLGVAQGFSPAIPSAVLVTYRASTHGWFVVSPQVTIDANGRVSFTIPGAGAYALVVADEMTPPVPIPDIDQPLTGVSMTALPVTATGVGTIAPATLPPAGGTASGSLAIQSPAPVPSGTIVQAQVTETYTLTSGATASEEQRTEDIILYRTPAARSNPESQIPNPSLSAFFPITPTRTYQTSTLTTGVVHLDILAGRESVRGQTGGSEPVSIDAGGGVTLTVPAHALPADTAVRVQPAILSSFLPGAAPNSAPPDVQPVGEVVVDFSSATLGLSAELTIPAPADVISNVAQGFSPAFVVTRVVRIDGIPRLLVVARAEAAGDRLVSRGLVGLPGITVGGRYVFYRVGGGIGFVAGLLSASGSPVAGVIESDSLPFIGIAGADGRFVIAARAADVRLTGHVSGTALQGTATVTVPVGAITSRDVVLAGAVTTAIVTPSDGATLVAVSAQLEIATSAPLDTTAVASASVALVANPESQTPNPATVRRVVSGSGRVLAIIPEASLQAATTYRLDVSGLVDVYGGAVAVPPVTFTTKADTAAVFDPEQVTVSFPDDNGIVHVTAPPGVVPPLTNVLVVNAGNGVVASFQAGNDGSMSHELTASIRDRLIVTITDPRGRTFSFERSTYVAPDGTTGVGSGGGKVKSATTEAEIDIPEGAIDDSAVFKIDGLDLSSLFPDDPSIADLFGATVGSSIKIEAPANLALKDEAKLAFAKPAEAPADAFYFVYRRLQGPDGKIAFETIDEAAPDPKTGKITTASPPFSGYTNSIGAYGVGGVDIGGGTSYLTMMYAEVDRAMPGRAAMGVITGKVLRQVFDPGAASPHYEGVPNAMVSGVDASGQPLVAKTTGASAAISQKDGTFSLFDKAYQGGAVTLSATTPDGDVKTATAYESNPQDLKSPGLGKYRNIATANITFPAKSPAAPPPAIDILIFTVVNDTFKDSKGVVAAGTQVQFGFKGKNTTVSSATIQGAVLPVRPETKLGPRVDTVLNDPYIPSAPGAYTITATASQPFGPPVTSSLTFRVIAAGGNASSNLPNDPPAVVTGLTVPTANAKGVQPTIFPQVTFTEPVKNIPQHVALVGGPGGTVAVTLSGDGPDGPIESITSDSQVVTSLTIQPLQPLLYNTTYTLTLTSGIIDLDYGLNGQPAPKPLVPFTTTFTTFELSQFGQSAETYNSPAIVVLGDRGYLAVPQPNQTALKVYDVKNPAAPRELLPSQPVVAIGYPYDLVGEEASPATGGNLLALTTGPIGVPYRPSNVLMYDVATDQPKWIGAVTLGNSPTDGVARRTVLKDGVLYAATAGIGKGIQIVDMTQAMSNFQAATVNGTSSREYYQMLADLGLEGQGFGQDAVTNTIFVNTGSGDNSRLWDLAVGDLPVDGTPTRIVAATGASALVTVDPIATDVLYNGRVLTRDGATALVWGYSLALTKVGAQDIAVVVGFNSGASNLLLVTVSLVNPRQPYALGSLSLSPGQFDTRSRLVIKDGVVYVGGIGVTTLVGIADPAHPYVQGTLVGVGGNLATTANGFLFGVGSPLGQNQSTGIKTAALGTTAYVSHVSVSELTNNPGGATTAQDVVVDFKVVPESYMIQSANVEVYRDNQLIDTLPGTVSGAAGQAVWPKGRPVARDASYTTRVVVEPSEPQPLRSVQVPIPLVQIVFVDKRGKELLVPPTSDPRPRVVLDPVSASDVSIRPNLTEADVQVRGTVTDSLADLVPDHAADIRHVTFGDQSLPVLALPEQSTAVRPFAFRGRFSGTVRVPVQEGFNRIAIAAENAVGNRGAGSVAVTIRQALQFPDPPPTTVFSADKYIDPFTLIVHPLREDTPDTLVLYHHAGAPAGDEVPLVETGENTLVFAGNTAALGDVTVRLTASPAGNELRATVSTSMFAMIAEPLTFVETAASPGTFKTIARRLPDNSRLRIDFTAPLSTSSSNAAAVTLDKTGGALTATLNASAPGSLTFRAFSGALGPSTLQIQSIEGGNGLVRRLKAFFTSGTAGLSDYYVALNETAPDSQRFETETRSVVLFDDPQLPTVESTSVVSVTAEPESPDVAAEPVWVVAKGLREAQPGDVGMLDGSRFDLVVAAAPGTNPQSARFVRFAQPITFVKNVGPARSPNIRPAVVPQQGFDRTTVEPVRHTAEVTIGSMRISRRFSSLGLSKAVVVKRQRNQYYLSFWHTRPDLRVASISVSGGEVSVSNAFFQEPQILGEVSVSGQFSATASQAATRGARDLIVTFTNGESHTFAGALTVAQGRAMVFAIDGLSESIFNRQVNRDLTTLNRLFRQPKTRNQAIDTTVLTTFPPITFTRWATIFSGHPPSETAVPALQWLNRQALINPSGDFGAVNQGLGVTDARLVNDVLHSSSAYNRHFKVDFVYDTLRTNGFRSTVVMQQAGLGKGNTQETRDRWLTDPNSFSTIVAGGQIVFGSSSNGMDELATRLATQQIASSFTDDFDLLVVYLPGLDHQLHESGLFDEQGRDVADAFFAAGLDERLRRIVGALGPRAESTIFGLYADHGHFAVLRDRSIELDSTGAALGPMPLMRDVLHAKESFNVGAKYEEGLFGARPNVIFAPQFAMANVYVAANALVEGQAPDWTRPPAIKALEPIVNNLFTTYVNHPWPQRPIADILVRVPGADGGFTNSRYMVVPRNYRLTGSNCGPTQDQACTLANQLVGADSLATLGVGDDFDDVTSRWLYAAPEERLAGTISVNSGDIVLLANGRWYYQFGKPQSAQHGSLTSMDALVPMAFSFPAATGGPAQDDMLAPITEFFKSLPAAPVPACSAVSRQCVEEKVLEQFFIKPPSQ